MADDRKKMPRTSGNEPQSYGSGHEWVTGKTGPRLNDQIETEGDGAKETAMYESKIEGERSAPGQGGEVSPKVESHARDQQTPDSSATEVVGEGAKKVTETTAGGRESYYKERDYTR